MATNEGIVTVKDSRKYKTLVTDVGNAKIANAALNGKKVNITTAAVFTMSPRRT